MPHGSLKSGVNGVGIPDLGIAKNSVQNECAVYVLDKYFALLKANAGIRLHQVQGQPPCPDFENPERFCLVLLVPEWVNRIEAGGFGGGIEGNKEADQEGAASGQGNVHPVNQDGDAVAAWIDSGRDFDEVVGF